MARDMDGFDDEDYGPEPVATEIRYRVTFYAYCGMKTFDETYDDESEAREVCARILRRRRRSDHVVTVSAPGSEWEAQEPEDSIMVPDTAGTLSLSEILPPDDFVPGRDAFRAGE